MPNVNRFKFSILLSSVLFPLLLNAQDSLFADLEIGIFQRGAKNGITDVSRVSVGHTTIVQGDSVRTGVTAILPHQGNIYQNKVPAAIYIGNGYGKLAGYSQVRELGNIETPIVLTNTLSVPIASEALMRYTLDMPGNERVRSVNAIVGETNDGYLNDIRGMHVRTEHVLSAVRNSSTDRPAEGNVGAGTCTIAFGYKGGIGTSSRVLPEELGGYTVGVLVQSNFGGILQVAGVPVGKELGKYPYSNYVLEKSDGSCMIVVATDAPVGPRNLERIAKRAIMGLAKTGGIASNGSGDYVIAFSNYEGNLLTTANEEAIRTISELDNSKMTPLFAATIEATEEAIINSLLAAEDMTGHQERKIEALPQDEVLKILQKYGRLK
jgi:D-aminopeptidase